MTIQLFIGEVAELLGVTTKAIRYYEEIGLLDEPQRTEAGYRLYGAQDLLRLSRVKQMQDLGLSLERIRTLLQGPDHVHVAQDILHTLEAEITAQIAALEERRAHVRELLTQAPADALMQSRELPPTLKLLQEELGRQVNFDAAFDAAAPSYAEQLWVQLDGFLWEHAEYRQQQRELIQHLAAHPETRTEIADLMTQIAALAAMPAETQEVEKLADEIVRLRAQNPILAKMMSFGDRREQSSVDILAQILTGATELTPAQQRLFQLVGLRLAG